MTSRQFVFATVTFIIGLMIAFQLQALQTPDKRETTDSIELRKKIDLEKKHQQQLLSEISNGKQILNEYKKGNTEENEAALEKTLLQLKEKAGVTQVVGEGITITLQPLFSKEMIGEEPIDLSSTLLSELINQLNFYGATAIAIEDERIVNTSSIREVNGKLYINQSNVDKIPLTLTIASDDPDRLRNKMIASDLPDYFAVDNIEIVVSEIKKVTVPAYQKTLKTEYLK